MRRHLVEDGEHSDTSLPPFRPAPDVRAIQTQIGMTQDAFGKTTGVPVATMHNQAGLHGLSHRQPAAVPGRARPCKPAWFFTCAQTSSGLLRSNPVSPWTRLSGPCCGSWSANLMRRCGHWTK